MATFGSDSKGTFKNNLLDEIRYRKDECGLTWRQVLFLLLEVLTHLTEYHIDDED